MNSNKPQALKAKDLECTTGVDLNFGSSRELAAFSGVLGHQRAFEALEFGLAMAGPGYNIYVAGEPGTGRLSLVRQRVREFSKRHAGADDWVYLPNFSDVRSPVCLNMPAGTGRRLVEGVEAFIDGLLASFSVNIENPSYRRRRAKIEACFNERYEQAISLTAERAKAMGIALIRDGEAVSFSPLLGDEPATEEEFASFREPEKELFHENARLLEQSLADALIELPVWRRETGEEIQRLNRDTVEATLETLLHPLIDQFSDSSRIESFIGGMKDSLILFLTNFLLAEPVTGISDYTVHRSKFINEYLPRLLVDNSAQTGCPVIFEASPTMRSLFGYVDHVVEQGNLVTRHGLINAGAFHLANGGFLILEAEKLFGETSLWSAVKRTLSNQCIQLECTAGDAGLSATISLTPQNVALDLRVILVGSREWYYSLQEVDGEFRELFRILADFDEFFPRTQLSETDLLRLLATEAERKSITPFSQGSALRLLQFGCRLAGDRSRLSSRVGELLALLAEADQLRKSEAGDGETIDQDDIEAAISARNSRTSRLQEAFADQVLKGVVLLETSGTAVGRINGLTVVEVGDLRFGNPARISATVFPGSRGVVDIERESDLGEAIHSKGVMILTGYLGYRYGKDLRMAFSANIALEQSYGRIDGDSAALAELCALISSVANIGLLQSLAVTGSVSQYGEVQAVGGVNEKIEGYFDICAARGFAEDQGVIIPKANLQNLVLDKRVRMGVADNTFKILPVTTVDEALTLLTGVLPHNLERLVTKEMKRLTNLSVGAERRLR